MRRLAGRAGAHALWTVLALIAVGPNAADAFEYTEHKDVSNEGFRRAREYVEANYAKLAAACCLAELRAFAGESPFSAKNYTFGDLVALVDYVSDPNDFLYRRGFDPLNGSVGLNFLNEPFLRRLSKDTFRALHSAHNDRNHFQDGALSTFWTWHRVAMLTASPEGGGDLKLALVYSAFSLHFLEDFFAPGHVRTPRASLHDAAAMNIHDRFNGRGQCFKVQQDRLSEIAPPFLDRRTYDELQATGFLFLMGDGRLARPTARNRSQATFLAALVGRAIADVIESYLAGLSPSVHATNHFNDWKWGPYEISDVSLGTTCSGEQPSTALFDWLGIARTLSPEACIHFGCYDRVVNLLPLGITTMIAVEAGPQAFLGGESTNQAQGELSVGPILLLSPSKEWREGKGTVGLLQGVPQVFGGVEWNHVFARGYSADGVRVRTYLPLTAVDLQLTASGTYRWYRGANLSGGRWSWDGGIQFGFGLVFTGLSVGRQHALDDADGRLKPAWVLTGNLTLLVSPSIVTKFRNDPPVKFGD